MLTSRATTVSPVIVHQDTHLQALEPQLCASPYVLATDDAGCIVGVISIEQILQRLNASNFHERLRWAKTPIRALIGSLLPSPNSDSDFTARPVSKCTAIVEDGRLFGLMLDDDMYSQLESIGAIAVWWNHRSTDRPDESHWIREEEWRRAQRSDTSVGVLVVDLDRFKEINDNHGHQAGDVVLRHVAHILDDELRSYDLVARYGGDEFVALCLGCRSEEIEIPVRRVLRALTSNPVVWRDQTLQVSASVGAAVRHSGFEDCDPHELFSAADERLYQAKETRATAFRVEFKESKHAEIEPIRWRETAETVPGESRSQSVQHDVHSVVKQELWQNCE